MSCVDISGALKEESSNDHGAGGAVATWSPCHSKSGEVLNGKTLFMPTNIPKMYSLVVLRIGFHALLVLTG